MTRWSESGGDVFISSIKLLMQLNYSSTPFIRDFAKVDEAGWMNKERCMNDRGRLLGNWGLPCTWLVSLSLRCTLFVHMHVLLVWFSTCLRDFVHYAITVFQICCCIYIFFILYLYLCPFSCMTLKYFNFIKKWKGSQLLLTELYFRMIALIQILNS